MDEILHPLSSICEWNPGSDSIPCVGQFVDFDDNLGYVKNRAEVQNCFSYVIAFQEQHLCNYLGEEKNIETTR